MRAVPAWLWGLLLIFRRRASRKGEERGLAMMKWSGYCRSWLVRPVGPAPGVTTLPDRLERRGGTRAMMNPWARPRRRRCR